MAGYFHYNGNDNTALIIYLASLDGGVHGSFEGMRYLGALIRVIFGFGGYWVAGKILREKNTLSYIIGIIIDIGFICLFVFSKIAIMLYHNKLL